MSNNDKVRKEFLSRTRADSCRLASYDFMNRNMQSIGGQASDAVVRDSNNPEGGLTHIYLDGYIDGFSKAVELMLSGDLDITEVTIQGEG